MDPNATLRDIIKCARAIRDGEADPTYDMADPVKVALAGEDLANMILGLDHWLEQGGFPPDAWRGSFLDGLVGTVNSIAATVESVAADVGALLRS